MEELSDKVLYKVRCPRCGKIFKLRLFPEDVEKYNNGMYIT